MSNLPPQDNQPETTRTAAVPFFLNRSRLAASSQVEGQTNIYQTSLDFYKKFDRLLIGSCGLVAEEGIAEIEYPHIEHHKLSVNALLWKELIFATEPRCKAFTWQLTVPAQIGSCALQLYTSPIATTATCAYLLSSEDRPFIPLQHTQASMLGQLVEDILSSPQTQAYLEERQQKQSLVCAVPLNIS